MSNADEIAEGVQGRIAGALKRWDTEDQIPDEVQEGYAAKFASLYGREISARFSDETVAEMVNDD